MSESEQNGNGLVPVAQDTTAEELAKESLERVNIDEKAPEKIESQAVATATAQKIHALRVQRKALVDAGRELKRRIDAAIAQATDRMDEATSKRMEPLAKWAWLVLRGEKTKSKDLGGVKVGFRKGQGKLEVLDEGAAIQFSKDNDLPVKVKESVDKKALKDFLKDNPDELRALAGSVVEYTTSGERFYVD